MNRCTRRIGVMLWVAIGSGPSPASFAAASFKRFDRLSEDFGHARELLRVPGLAATVVEDGRVVWHQEFGMADLERRAPVTATTEFCVASITKTMAAIVLLQMVHERRLRLDEPIPRHNDSPSFPNRIPLPKIPSATYCRKQIRQCFFASEAATLPPAIVHISGA